ncbi:MAG TPA: flagellar protein FlaG [Bryobacteraceae bacterium]|nr:flagellar protein FlaG [Bryobacteraceae bacterium]
MEIASVSSVDRAWAPVVQPVSSEQLAETRDLVVALKAVNKSEMFGQDQELTFVLDRQTQRTVIQLVDRKTREVVRQIPPEYVLQAAKELQPRQKSP